MATTRATPPPLNQSDQQLLDTYLESLTTAPRNTPRLFAIGFLGLPGTGKSTLANALHDRLGLPLNRSDQIRRYLNSIGFPGPNPRQDIMAALAEGRTEYFYQHDTSAIIDANFAEYAANSRATAARYDASLLLIQLVCPDEVARERVRARSLPGAATSDSALTIERYDIVKTRAESFAPVTNPYYVIDSTQDLAPQVEALCDKLTADGYITR
jgi:predicted kinase